MSDIVHEKEFANFVSENTRIMGCPIFAKLPTPLVRFCPILLEPPNPQKNRTSLMDVPLHEFGFFYKIAQKRKWKYLCFVP
jgi:hypothetical protein